MALTPAITNNYDYVELYLGKQDVIVTNDLGRDVDHLELVYLGGYFGEVREYDGIADSASGVVNLSRDRVIQTKQMEATDTFVAGQIVFFLPGGSSAAGLIRATPESGSIPVGRCTGFGGSGGAHTYVEFKYEPLIQYASSIIGQVVKSVETEITADATAGVLINIPVGAKIIDATVLCTATVGGGTMQLKTGAVTPAIISDAIACDTDEILSRAGQIKHSNRIVGVDGVKIFSAAAGDRGIVNTYYL